MGIMTLHDLMDTFHTLRGGAPGRALRRSHVCVGVPEEPGRLHDPAGTGRLRLRGGIHLLSIYFNHYLISFQVKYFYYYNLELLS